ncbi:MAG TPA: SGNH/GDSL hydrolase family protein [Cyclobacteriaceae bacterium]
MRNLIFFIVTAVVTLLLLDVFLKGVKITPPILKYYHSEYGSLNRPDINYFKSTQGLYIGKTNYDGRFRESYPKRKKDGKTLRILLVGDSFVEGIDVFSRDHFAQYMEDTLRKILNTNVEILNFGRGNCILHASSYYFINYLEKEYDADLVLYFTEFRDILPVASYPSTSFKLNETGTNLVADYSWQKSAEYNLHRKLTSLPLLKYYEDIALCRLGYRAWSGIQTRGFLQLTLGKFYGTLATPDYTYAKYDVPISDLSKKIYDSVMTFNKGQIVFVVRNLPVDATVVKEYFQEKHYPFIDLNEALDKEIIRGTNINAYYFKATQSYGGHWNHAGHKAIGHFLAKKISDHIKEYNTPNYSHE